MLLSGTLVMPTQILVCDETKEKCLQHLEQYRAYLIPDLPHHPVHPLPALFTSLLSASLVGHPRGRFSHLPSSLAPCAGLVLWTAFRVQAVQWAGQSCDI